MRIISQRKRLTSVTYCHEFVWADQSLSGGFSFECDKEGNVLGNKAEIAIDNYRKCKDGTYDVIDKGIREYHNHYVEPAIGECNRCGCKVALYGFTNTCEKCGTDYNMSGQELAPRSQWGEETGESLCDILSADIADID